jgi:hypothetical protein
MGFIKNYFRVSIFPISNKNKSYWAVDHIRRLIILVLNE